MTDENDRGRAAPHTHTPADDAHDVANFLADPRTYSEAHGTDHPIKTVETLETHASRVFLAGSTAYKVKKHVTLPFLDFATLQARKHALGRELELNRPHAPGIYRAVIPLTRAADGHITFCGEGAIIDYALEMTRFDQSALLSAIAASGPLAPTLCDSLADMVARYHERAPATTDSGAVTTGSDAVAAIETTIQNLRKQMTEFSPLFGAEKVAALDDALAAATDRALPLMIARAAQGAIRRCHGDLHLNNIVLLDGAPTPFDALEFDERLGVIDVLYDLAFLLMDLDAGGDRAAASRVLNRYLADAPLGNEIAGLRLLPLFLASRALVRTIVNAERTRQLTAEDAAPWRDKARHYFECARTYIAPQSPALIAIGGLSGTGKSTLARGLMADIEPFPGAIHLRSDIERKKLFAVAETDRLPKSAYTPEVSAEVYDRVLEKAARCLDAGMSTIIDVVASKADERAAIAAVAEKANVPCIGLWLEAPVDILVTRVEARTLDASDADANVVRQQSSYDLGNIGWSRIDAGHSPAETRAQARNILSAAGIFRLNGA